ncbi:28S ribosomal protein S9, mitochondrial [Galendromus occidentalis]|uniref:28S ribosomal protein S9, mitochondrial n=1 Tax=Galendromus occidentalis TaxID=34638 RepID=A0AAJ6QLL4_9ACAR|nr:28S ribosomal protein S9, mitochondrial [Galendromus occidentalis]
MWNRALLSPVLRDGAHKVLGVVAARANSSTQSSTKLENVLEPMVRKDEKAQKINRAMRAYLERAQTQEKFLSEKKEEFELGKRHLANIMGWDPEEITQENIDEAIQYLLPSGLFEPKARPMMKPPEMIFAKQKLAEFDYTGRPHNSLFYTARGNFYGRLHEAFSHVLRLNEHQLAMRKKGVRTPEAAEQFDLRPYDWINQGELAELCLERIKDEHHDYFIRSMTRLAEHPYSNMAREILLKYLKPKQVETHEQEILPLMHDEAGNPYMEARGERKSLRAIVKVTGNGTGETLINKSMSVDEYFPELKDRLQVMFPLQFVGLLNKVDVEATIFKRHDEYELGEMAKSTEEEQKELIKPLELRKGQAAEAGAIRLALSRALCSFVTEEDVKLMRLSGLLTKDKRKRERKKPGKRGARRRYPWRKR